MFYAFSYKRYEFVMIKDNDMLRTCYSVIELDTNVGHHKLVNAKMVIPQIGFCSNIHILW